MENPDRVTHVSTADRRSGSRSDHPVTTAVLGVASNIEAISSARSSRQPNARRAHSATAGVIFPTGSSTLASLRRGMLLRSSCVLFGIALARLLHKSGV